MPKKNKPDTHRATLRIPLPLWNRIMQSATYNGNTANAEIIARLEVADERDRFDQLSQEIAELKGLVLDSIKK